jgi:hypothetical protein
MAPGATAEIFWGMPMRSHVLFRQAALDISVPVCGTFNQIFTLLNETQ